MNGADAIVKCLELEGIKEVFGYPGVAICPFYNSILDSEISTVLIRTEQNAAHAASGLARVTGQVGVWRRDLRSRGDQSDHRHCNSLCRQHTPGLHYRTGEQRAAWQ